MLDFAISKRRIGKKCPVFITAEISANHGQNFQRAVKLIKKARECGADAVKFQTYTPDTITIDTNNRYFRVKDPKWGGRSLYELYKKGYTPWSWFTRLKTVCDDMGIIFFSTAFDKTSVDLLEDIGVPAHKISSFELVDLPLISYAAKTKKPLIISTGMASPHEIEEAVCTARRAGAKKILLLKCVSDYPASPEEMNLKTISDMTARFKCPVGLSDHTLNSSVALTAVAVGAVAIEKHFTLSRKTKTPDSFFSIEPEELQELVKNIRVAEEALGNVHYGLTAGEKRNIHFRRSLFAVRSIKAGEKFTEENVRSIRPGHGLKPKYFCKIIGKKARNNIKMGSPLNWSHIR